MEHHDPKLDGGSFQVKFSYKSWRLIPPVQRLQSVTIVTVHYETWSSSWPCSQKNFSHFLLHEGNVSMKSTSILAFSKKVALLQSINLRDLARSFKQLMRIWAKSDIQKFQGVRIAANYRKIHSHLKYICHTVSRAHKHYSFYIYKLLTEYRQLFAITKRICDWICKKRT